MIKLIFDEKSLVKKDFEAGQMLVNIYYSRKFCKKFDQKKTFCEKKLVKKLSKKMVEFQQI